MPIWRPAIIWTNADTIHWRTYAVLRGDELNVPICFLTKCCLMKYSMNQYWVVQYIPRNMHTVFALLCFVVVIHWLIFPYPSGLLHWHCGNLTIAPVPAKQPWWIWINTSCEFIMNDCITTTKQSTTKPCAHFLGYTVLASLLYNNAYIQSQIECMAQQQCISWMIWFRYPYFIKYMIDAPLPLIVKSHKWTSTNQPHRFNIRHVFSDVTEFKSTCPSPDLTGMYIKT